MEEYIGIRAVSDHIIVEQVTGPKQAGLIEMPDIARTFAYGRVIDIGPGEVSALTTFPLKHQLAGVKVDDIVVFNTCGRQIRVGTRTFEIVRMNEVHAVLDVAKKTVAPKSEMTAEKRAKLQEERSQRKVSQRGVKKEARR